jgi:flagellar FliL protein
VAEDNAAAKSTEGGSPEKSSSSKPIILYALVILNMLVVGGVGFMVMKGRQKDAAQPKIDDVIAGEHEAQKDDKEKEGEFIGKTIPMETFLVNLSGAQGRKLLKVDMELEVEGDKVREEIEKRKPQIRDIIITLLSSKTLEQVASNEGKEFLREEVRDTVNSFLTRGKIKQVLFTGFIYN